jgi:hypothetical protein
VTGDEHLAVEPGLAGLEGADDEIVAAAAEAEVEEVAAGEDDLVEAIVAGRDGVVAVDGGAGMVIFVGAGAAPGWSSPAADQRRRRHALQRTAAAVAADVAA